MNATMKLIKGGLNDKPELNFESLIDKFILYRQVKPNTANVYRSVLNHFITNCSNPLQSAYVHLYIEDMKKEFSPLTIDRRLTVIKTFCQYLTDHDIIENKVHLQVNYNYEYRGGKKERIDDDKFLEMLDTCDLSSIIGVRDYALLRLLQSTAMRVHEPLSCKVRDVTVAHHPSGEKVRLLTYTQKGGHKAVVRLFPKTWEAIDVYLNFRGDRRADAPLFASHNKRSSEDSHFDKSQAQRMIRLKFNQIGLIGSRYTAHSFRYTQAIKALEATGDEHKASQQLRHLSPKTIQYYTQDYRNRLLGLNMLDLEV